MKMEELSSVSLNIVLKHDGYNDYPTSVVLDPDNPAKLNVTLDPIKPVVVTPTPTPAPAPLPSPSNNTPVISDTDATKSDYEQGMILLNKGIELQKQGKSSDAQKDFEDAEKYLKNAVETDPKNSDYLFYLGYTYHAMGQYGNAVKYLEPASKLKPGNDEYRNTLGLSYYSFGVTFYNKRDYKNAVIYLQKAVDLVPKNRDYQKTLEAAKSFLE